MIINTGCRTDIPAYYSDWFYNRIKKGYVLTRNPYRPEQVFKYALDPSVVDIISFCTKNPEPMLKRLNEIEKFRQFWFVTVTPYGKEIEPNVPDKWKVLESVKRLSTIAEKKAVGWRYDPIFITGKYSIEYHIRCFEKMAETLSGYVNSCVISFIDLYEKTKRNFPQVRAVTAQEQETLARAFAEIGKRYDIPVRSCCENKELAKCGVDISGCMTKAVLEAATDCSLSVPRKKKSPRAGCDCLLSYDIGMYNTCPHGCVYCYANYDSKSVARNKKMHDPQSPFLIGNFRSDDKVTEVRQESYLNNQMNLFR